MIACLSICNTLELVQSLYSLNWAAELLSCCLPNLFLSLAFWIYLSAHGNVITCGVQTKISLSEFSFWALIPLSPSPHTAHFYHCLLCLPRVSRIRHSNAPFICRYHQLIPAGWQILLYDHLAEPQSSEFFSTMKSQFEKVTWMREIFISP